jgi:hypothetical protein
MVRTGKNTYKLAPAHRKPDELDPEQPHQQNVRELVLELDDDESDLPPDDGGDRFGNAVGARRLGIVLDHGCELDEQADPQMVHVAVVRELSRVPEVHRESIRSYDQKRTFFLPASDALREDHYVDFRFVTTVRRALLDSFERVASLSEDGRTALKGQLVRFWTRKRLPDGWWEWPDEAEERAHAREGQSDGA